MRTNTKVWSSWQPALRVPGGPRVEEVKPREEGAEVVGRAQNTSRGQGSHTQVPLQYFTGSKNCLCVFVYVCVQMNKEEWDVSPQTILFSSKAILFDILSSKILLRTATTKTNKTENPINDIKTLPPNIIFSDHFK